MKTFEDLYMDEYSLHQHADIPMQLAQADTAPSVGVVANQPTDEIRAIEPSKLENALAASGIGLEQAGQFLQSLGSVNVGGIELSLRDLVPFMGHSVDGVEGGTPKLLQQMGRGESITSGTGQSYGIKESAKGDVASAAFDVASLGIPRFAAGAARAVKKMATKKLSRSILKSGETPAALEGK
jgi:hypothetical protein